MMRKLFAWLVHLYTAMGLVCAAGMAVLIMRGDDAGFRGAFLLMMVATAVDATDGWLARKARVKEVLPGFDGAALDNLIDFQTYTTLPLFLIWRADLLPGAFAWLLLLPLLASAYGFSQVNAKTDDGFFLGFPSYWNIVALYLYLFRPPVWVSLTVIIMLSILTFVPWRYLYPSQRAPFSLLTNLLAVVWVILLQLSSARVPDSTLPLLICLAFPAYYMLMSWALTLHLRRNRSSSTTIVKPT